MKPVTKYTKSGSINIAYQVFGSGSIDLVYIPGWVSNIDWMWECPELVDFIEQLGKVARVILFDKRGTGLSDRLSELSTLEERMDDIRAVMDAADSQKAILFGHSEGGCASALFAATYPNRVVSLIMFGAFAKRRYSSEYPWAPTDEERQKVYDMIENSWGKMEMGLETLAPSKANDKIFMTWLASYFRSGASPSAAMVLTKMNTQVDIINILGSIKVPTLILQRKNDIDVKIEEGKFIAERIEGAKFVELKGDDHLFWVGDTEGVLSHIKRFVLDEKPPLGYERQLSTIVVAKASRDLALDPKCEDFISGVVHRYRGNLVKYDGKKLIALFEGPSRAVNFSFDLQETGRTKDVELALGVDMREVSMNENYFSGIEVENFTESFIQMIPLNQIFITQTVKYLLSGAGLKFEQETALLDVVSQDAIPLYSVIDPDHLEVEVDFLECVTQKDSFLEIVLKCINTHLMSEAFNVSTLCKSIGTSERQLQRKLKTTTNKTPNQLISSVRMYKAKELLLSRKFNIAEVAYKVGFSSPSYFARKFKEEFGISPSLL